VRRLAEHQPLHLRLLIGGEPEAGQAFDQPLKRLSGLEPGQVNADTDMRALREGQMAAEVGPCGVEAVGIGEHRGIAVGCGD
jgi:F420-0:gamma-glutamyl ligase